jgi:DNA (cytosine-5)-methyltransferase 1
MAPSQEDRDAAREALLYARRFFGQEQLAERLNKSPRTIRRWEKGQIAVSPIVCSALREILHQKTERPKAFRFIDLFAGIGGLRIPFERLGGSCVFTCEWDAHCTRTYRANFADDHDIRCDIQDVQNSDVPDHDLLLAGFPCQPFSLAGVSKKNSLGRAHGFADETQGTLFFELVRIIKAKQPRVFLLENVKNLRSHDGGRTYRVITEKLAKLEYQISDRVIDAQHWLPQHRERIFILGFREPVLFGLDDLVLPNHRSTLGSVLHRSDEEPESPYTIRLDGCTVVARKYTLSDHLWTYLQNYATKHRAKGNGFGYSVFGESDVARTLSARYHKDGSEILLSQGTRRNPRRLTPRECARLMGFDGPGRPRFEIPVSDTQAYRQFGNAVAVPVVEAIAEAIIPLIARRESAAAA